MGERHERLELIFILLRRENSAKRKDEGKTIEIKTYINLLLKDFRYNIVLLRSRFNLPRPALVDVFSTERRN